MPAGTLSDAQVERFERLAWGYLPVLMRAALAITHRHDQAEDLVQETMIKALHAIERFQNGGDIKAWLMTILRRTFIDLYRSRGHERGQRSLEEGNVPEPAGEMETQAAEHDGLWTDPRRLLERFEDEQIIEALRTLPDDIRWTLLLVDVEELDQRQAAEVLGVAVGTIKSRAHRGRGMLRDRLMELARQRGWVKEDGGEAKP